MDFGGGKETRIRAVKRHISVPVGVFEERKGWGGGGAFTEQTHQAWFTSPLSAEVEPFFPLLSFYSPFCLPTLSLLKPTGSFSPLFHHSLAYL